MNVLQAAATHESRIAEVRVELVRADAKASTQLALVGLGVVAIVTALRGGSSSPLTQVAAWTAVAVLLAAALLLTSVVRPDLRGGYGFMLWADGALDDAAQEDGASDVAGEAAAGAQLQAMSRLARTKFRYLRAAVDLTRVAVLLVGVAFFLGWVTP